MENQKNEKSAPAYYKIKVYAGAFLFMQRVREQVEDIYGERTDGGSGIVIAMLDTGVSAHPDLNDRILCFRDFVGYSYLGRLRDSRAYDDNGHGTHVAGILCGSGALSSGKYRGLAPGARLVVGKVLDERGDGSTDAMLKGLDWVMEIRERYRIRILNISVGIGDMENKQKEGALQAKLEQLWHSGMLVVCAAGNKGPREGSVSSVGGSSQVVTVGCHDGNFKAGLPWRCANYSGRGVLGEDPRKPDLVAPGTEIVSCSADCYKHKGKYINSYVAKSGTSMATPIVSAAAALALERYPSMTNNDCRLKLQYTATDLGAPWNQQGWGMVNVRRLLA